MVLRMLASEMPSRLGLHARGRSHLGSKPLTGDRVGLVPIDLYSCSPSVLTRLLTGQMAPCLRLHACRCCTLRQKRRGRDGRGNKLRDHLMKLCQALCLAWKKVNGEIWRMFLALHTSHP